ncbi:AMP-binding enzyme family protein [Mycobacterium xenopi 3993]|nr:AMP-binding enzyme family protein [Mycobacterium xenopi 3993]
MRAEFGAPVFSAYGMTEATHQVASTRDDRAVTTGLVGRSSGVEIRIVGEDGWPARRRRWARSGCAAAR